MKFVCVECDQPMKFDNLGGMEADGSLAVTFRCPACEWGVTMLTNPQETQMVRTLGVKIGGGEVPAAPMAMMRGFLDHAERAKAAVEPTATGENPGAAAVASKCPFAAMVSGVEGADKSH